MTTQNDKRTWVDKIANLDFRIDSGEAGDKLVAAFNSVPGFGRLRNSGEYAVKSFTKLIKGADDFITAPLAKRINQLLGDGWVDQHEDTFADFIRNPAIKLAPFHKHNDDKYHPDKKKHLTGLRKVAQEIQFEQERQGKRSKRLADWEMEENQVKRARGNVNSSTTQPRSDKPRTNSAEQWVIEKNPGPKTKKQKEKKKAVKRVKKIVRKLKRITPRKRMPLKSIAKFGQGLQGVGGIRKGYFKTSRGRDPQSGKGTLRVKAREYWDTLTLDSAKAAGTRLFSTAIHPMSFGSSSRLARFAANYEFYKFHKLSFHYVPDVATTATGQVGGFYEPDVGDEEATMSLGSGQLKNRLITSHGVAKPVREPLVVSIKHNNKHKDPFYIDPSSKVPEKDVYQGMIVFVYMTPVGGAYNYELWIDYDVTFYTPTYEDVEQTTNIAGSQFVTVSSGTETKTNPFGSMDAGQIQSPTQAPIGLFIATDANDAYLGQFQLPGANPPTALLLETVSTQVSGTNPTITFATTSNLTSTHNTGTVGTGVTTFVSTTKYYLTNNLPIATPSFSVQSPSVTYAGMYINSSGLVTWFTSATPIAYCLWYIKIHSDTVPTSWTNYVTFLNSRLPSQYLSWRKMNLGSLEQYAVDAYSANPKLNWDDLLSWHRKFGAVPMTTENKKRAEQNEIKRISEPELKRDSQLSLDFYQAEEPNSDDEADSEWAFVPKSYRSLFKTPEEYAKFIQAKLAKQTLETKSQTSTSEKKKN